ncbi:hypothetical protein F5884DRAFT_799729 [Xylogone sp. PMI_703]|nr:hypothetical protein F5884DRAFT_799729 [Xylogone sp. PMI_703]
MQIQGARTPYIFFIGGAWRRSALSWPVWFLFPVLVPRRPPRQTTTCSSPRPRCELPSQRSLLHDPPRWTQSSPACAEDLIVTVLMGDCRRWVVGSGYTVAMLAVLCWCSAVTMDSWCRGAVVLLPLLPLSCRSLLFAVLLAVLLDRLSGWRLLPVSAHRSPSSPYRSLPFSDSMVLPRPPPSVAQSHRRAKQESDVIHTWRRFASSRFSAKVMR